MPILSLEPNIYPENLLYAHSGDANARRWRVLQTRSRQEKSLARQLHEQRVPFFLPLIPNRLKVRGKVLTSFLPLFSGYLFLFANEEEHLVALQTRRVARALEVANQERLWVDLKQVHQLISSGVPITPEGRLVPGTPVVIKSGPLSGLHGLIVKSATGNRFIVKIDFIERGASILMDDFVLSAIV